MPEQTRLNGVPLNGDSVGEVDPSFDNAPKYRKINASTIN